MTEPASLKKNKTRLIPIIRYPKPINSYKEIRWMEKD